MTSEEIKSAINAAEAWGVSGLLSVEDLRRLIDVSKAHLARLAADEQREFERTRLLSLLREVMACGVSYKGNGYAELQVPHWLIAKIRASVQDSEKGGT